MDKIIDSDMDEAGLDAALAVLKRCVIGNDVNLRRLARKVVKAYDAAGDTRDDSNSLRDDALALMKRLPEADAVILQALLDFMNTAAVRSQRMELRLQENRDLRAAIEHLATCNLTNPHDFRQFARNVQRDLGIEN